MEAVVHYSKLSCSSSEMDLGRFKTLRETVNELFFDFGYARIAAISGWMPMMFITPGQIVGEHVQRHLGGDLGQTLHQEVRRPHPHLQRAKGMFGRLATLAHRLRVPVEALLHSLQ